MKTLYIVRGVPGSGKSTFAKSIGGIHIEADQFFMENGKYNFDEHLAKLSEDIELLTINGKIDVLIYFNSKVSDDKKIASDIKTSLESKMPLKTAPKVNLIVTDFNDQTLPESCFRYPNSILVSDKGFTLIDPVTMEWELDPNLVSQSQIALKKLANVK